MNRTETEVSDSWASIQIVTVENGWIITGRRSSRERARQLVAVDEDGLIAVVRALIAPAEAGS